MKIVCAAVFAVLGAMLAAASAERPEPDPLLDRPISGTTKAPSKEPSLEEIIHQTKKEGSGFNVTLQEAIQQMEKDTGIKILCSEDTKRVVQGVVALGPFARSEGPRDTIREYADYLSENFALNWKFNAQDKTITLDLPWRVNDPRSAAALFKAIWEPEAVSKMDAEAIWDYRLNGGHSSPRGGKPLDPVLRDRLPADAAWQPAFSALLSKDQNFERAWKVRQRAALESAFRFPTASLSFIEAPALEAEMVDVKGDKYCCVFFRQNAEISPGSGCLSYYWFRPDGTLVGAGLMSTGWRCFWVDGKVENPPPTKPAKASEFLMTMAWNNVQFTRRFVLDSEGLKFMPGTPAEYFNEMGESLLVPPDKREKRPDVRPPEFRR